MSPGRVGFYFIFGVEWAGAGIGGDEAGSWLVNGMGGAVGSEWRLKVRVMCSVEIPKRHFET